MKQLHGVYIDGQFVSTGDRVPSYDPSTGSVWAEIEIGGAPEIDAAVAAARAAQRDRWGTLAPWQRARVLNQLACLLEEHRAELATLESTDNGKAIRDTGDEVVRGAEWLRFFAGAASTVYGDTIPLEEGLQASTYREPLGVVGAITPWSSPLYIYAWKLAPALACGNAVVIKPSELAAATCVRLAELAAEAGLPPGVLNVVTGLGSTTGAALAGHKGIDRLTFTGGVATGRIAARLAAENFTPATIEAGGKTALVVLDDADLDVALSIALRAGFRSAGQSCAHIGRVIVQSDIYASFLDRFVAGVRQIRQGPALDKRTVVGPVISMHSVNRCQALVDNALSAGGRVLSGGHRARAPECGDGYFFEPTILEGVGREARIMREETFGPIVTVQRVDTEDEALESANDSELGLVGAVMTRSLPRYQRFARELDVGVVCVNAFRPGHWLLPYGGRKGSGMGYDNGYDIVRDYTRIKTVVLGNLN